MDLTLDPAYTWVELHRNEDWEYAHGFAVDVRGDGEFFAKLSIGDTALYGTNIHVEQIAPALRVWSDGKHICGRGQTDSSAVFVEWLSSTIKELLILTVSDIQETLEAYGVGLVVANHPLSSTEFQPVLIDLASELAKTGGLNDLTQHVWVSLGTQRELVIEAPVKLESLGVPFDRIGEIYVARLPIKDGFVGVS